MKIETIKERIKMSKTKLEKINGTLERHNKQLLKKSKALIDIGIDLKNYDKYDRKVITSEAYWDVCDYESKLKDIENNAKKIREVNVTLAKLQEQLENQLAKEIETNNLIPEVLNVFLENWKQKCITFYNELATEYITLVSKEYTEYAITLEELKEFKMEIRNKETRRYEMVNKYSDEEVEKILSVEISEYKRAEIKRTIRYRYIQKFKDSHFASDMAVLEKIIEHHETINNIMLNKILDYDVKMKKETFISRIKEVIGEIKDLSGLNISSKGEINGIAKGLKANAKVETISAGGYAVQCWHYRVLVNTIK
ncbi:hypothetical protein [Clostridium tagluense]|uniref:Uncharacterized protein n=1 Tax=Clostridium tagluense TaxID=360422 RepID=A0A401USR3_9CLOT|nr:hypothetical protein [Clostridium tagluense]GCD12602.1 hypothetical protein Ctaglu_42250 [Clostridium tagluense]